MNLEIANRLVQLRKEHHLSQEELAEKIGISRQAVSKWERAESPPDTDNIILLSKLYHISIDELLRTSDEETLVSPCPQEPTTSNNDSPSTDPESTKKDKENAMEKFPYPLLVTIIYLAIGLIFNKWHPGWLIFLTIPIYYCIAEIIYPKQEK